MGDVPRRGPVSGPFDVGERILLIDQRDRTYLFLLESGSTTTPIAARGHDA